MTATFMAVPLAYGVLFSLVWLLGADLKGRQAAPMRLAFYTRVSAAALAGGLAAALLARTLARSVDPTLFLTIAAGTMVAATLAVAAAQTFCPRMPVPIGPPPPLVRETARALARQPYFRRLLAAGVLAALTGILVEFQFYLAAASAGHSARDNAVLFANLYLGLAVVAIGVQVLITPALQQRMGVGRTLLVLPVAIDRKGEPVFASGHAAGVITLSAPGHTRYCSGVCSESNSPSHATFMSRADAVSTHSSSAEIDSSACSRRANPSRACANNLGKSRVRTGGAKYACNRPPSNLKRAPRCMPSL